MFKNITKNTWISDDIIKEIKSKRGRKSKKELEILAKYQTQLDELGIVPEEKKLKKRGRKPKGGKIVKEINKITDTIDFQPNIILHLKCKANDDNNTSITNMDYNPNIEHIDAFNEVNDDLTQSATFYNIEITQENIENNNENNKNSCNKYNNLNTDYNPNIIYEGNNNNSNSKNSINNNNICNHNDNDEETITTPPHISMKSIWIKLKELQRNLHNNVVDTNSNCFWCTCKYDNPTVYIPKYIVNNKYEVYGCFCMPECAAGYLFSEHLDTSTKWERYALLNNMYKKIYNYEINIKPSPLPFYTLDKFLGNLTIEEYRKLSTKENVLLVVDKPLTRVLPELHDETNECPKIYYNENIKKKEYNLKRNKKTSNSKMKIDNKWGF
jgi:hypothetical protein